MIRDLLATSSCSNQKNQSLVSKVVYESSGNEVHNTEVTKTPLQTPIFLFIFHP